ncbi:MAG TPA: M12 family metallo-peptidase [Thermoanaerobaculia bacterium]|nr:M12 family metallo-peptidase [Thermoanaerobaculia bacterium]
MNHRLLPILTLLALAALPAHAAHAADTADTAEPRNLLTFEGSSRAATAPTPGIAAERRVSLDPAALSGNPRVELLDGKVYDTRRTSLERRGKDDFTWRGKLLLEGKEVGQMTLTAYAGHYAATLYTPSGLHQIEPVPGGHRLVQIDENGLPRCGGAISPPLSGGGGSRALPKVGKAAAAPVMDVLVLYDDAVRQKLGGDDAARAYAQQGIDVTNSAYDNSQINARVRLAGSQLISFFEDGKAEDELVSFQADPTAAALRQAASADLVSLLVETMNDACGIGYVMNKDALGPDFAPYAYNVVRRACGFLTLAHELGHNMGCEHDPGNANDTPAEASYPYAFGHGMDGQFHTVMAYPSACPTNACPEIPNFSNPGVSYQGLPTGIAGQRDNHQVINNTAALVASFTPKAPTAPCRPDANTLCLLGRRFKVELHWQNQYDGSSGTGKAIARTDLAGFFTFGDPSNVELMIKILDFGTAIKVFYGQLTDLHFSLTVTDTTSGSVKTYTNTAGNCGAIDQAAFASSTSGGLGKRAGAVLFGAAAASGSCRPGPATLCLGDGRFAVSVNWKNAGNNTSGAGGAVPLSSVTGAFYFTESSNLELLTKIIDFGDRIAFFYGTLSDLEYTLTVQDTVGGTQRTYHNPGGTFCGGLDNHAF